MKTLSRLILLVVCLGALAAAQTPAGPSLHGIVTDPSGASVPGTLVQLRGPGGEKRETADANGQYLFPALQTGKYTVRAIAKGFTVMQKQDFEVTGASTLDIQLTIETENQVINVQAEANKVSADPEANGAAIVLKEKELAALSDDPDELEQQLQAMAGPGAGPSGGQIYIDGFTGGQMPPKSSIREIRINSNPFSSEYDRPGFGRIEIFTKPGTDTIRGQVFMSFNDQYFNSRSALLAQSTRPTYKQEFFGVNLSGPIKKNKASFTFDGEHRIITENAFILATDLDANLLPQTINQAILTPQTRTTLSPKVDLTLNEKNTLSIRYQNVRLESDQQGVGSFSLASQGYNAKTAENSVQAIETAVISPLLINESRFQYSRSTAADTGSVTGTAIVVQDAFTGGGAQTGNSGSTGNHLEFSNMSTYNRKTHTFKIGFRAREAYDRTTSVNNFDGTYSFLGGAGPQLDANNNPITGTTIQLTALQVYQRTLLFQKQGLSDAQIRVLGGGATQFSLNAGEPTVAVKQFDIGLYFNDDWRLRPNLTVSYGLRYEAQSNIGDMGNFSPRVGIAWGIDAKGSTPGKTVLRAGFGTFYDRIGDGVLQNTLFYNGVTQNSYFIQNPAFFPTVPTLALLAASKQPQSLQFEDNHIVAPRTYQANIGVDRQINKYARVSVNYIASRGVHLLRSVDINAPIATGQVNNGLFPFGDSQQRFLTQSTGFSRTNQVFVSPSVNYKSLFLFGFYSLSYGKDDNEGSPADPYNLRAEWGPSSFADVRHRGIVGTSIPMPFKFSVSPFISANSGSPYDITTGRDTNGDGIASERPALVAGVAASACNSGNLKYAAGFGCFNLAPAAGTPTIERNSARGPGSLMVNLRLSRTWSFGNKGESGPANAGMGGMMGGGGGGGGGPRGGGGGGMPGGGPPPGMFGQASAKKYNLTLSVNARNALNHTNFSAPSGDLSSPYFGEYRGLASGFGPGGGGSSTYNRKIDVQLRLAF